MRRIEATKEMLAAATWGWLWSQRCLRFIGICKINKQLSKERMSVVWDVVDEKYVF